ncbi:hypothetical protein JS521_18240, partial [Streptomyces sp. RHZ10]|nr:hypothetical protein [Streptomyces durocortorensis]
GAGRAPRGGRDSVVPLALPVSVPVPVPMTVPVLVSLPVIPALVPVPVLLVAALLLIALPLTAVTDVLRGGRGRALVRRARRA